MARLHHASDNIISQTKCQGAYAICKSLQEILQHYYLPLDVQITYVTASTVTDRETQSDYRIPRAPTLVLNEFQYSTLKTKLK
jgi:hypothetical protein